MNLAWSRAPSSSLKTSTVPESEMTSRYKAAALFQCEPVPSHDGSLKAKRSFEQYPSVKSRMA